MNKLLAFGVILLFFGVAFPPSIYADESIEQQVNNIIYSQDEKLISLPVREYKPDGTIHEYFVELTQSQYDEMTERLQTAKDLDERLSIYKDYRVVPEDVTSESLRAGMEEKAQRFGLDKKIDKMMREKENLPSSVESINMHYNLFCSVEFGFFWSIFPAIGLSPLIIRINWIIFLFYAYFKYPYEMPFQIPCIDIITLCIGVGGAVQAINGTMPDFELGYDSYYIPSFIGCVLAVGFVGYAFGGVAPSLPFRFGVFWGYASFICTVGNQ